MRTLLLAAILVLGSLTVPTVAAESPLTDAQGDVQFVLTGGTDLADTPMSGEQADSSDLLALDVTETDDDFTFVVTVASLKGGFTGSEYIVDFEWNDKDYRVVMGYWSNEQFSGGTFSYGYLLAREGDTYEYVAFLGEAEADVEKGTVAASVPKVYVLDGLKRIPGRGDSITGLAVHAERRLDFYVGAEVGFRAEDDMDEGAGAFTFALGDYSQGNLVLTSPERVRVSNGGSTTFVYEVVLRNLAESEDEIALSVVDLPDGWNVTYQSPIKVPAKGGKTVSILASVPFGHTHGGFDSFDVTAQSATDPNSQGRMRMGVLHTPIPQPAGHHNELYLHADDPRGESPPGSVFSALFPYATGWMNTESSHEGDHPTMSPNWRGNGMIRWAIPLNPRLQLGLDFDLEKTGTLTASIEGKRSGEGEVNANLFYYRETGADSEEILLAEGEPVAVTWDTQKPTSFSVTLTPTLESDYIPYASGAGMYLVVSMTGGAQDVGFNQPMWPLLQTEDFKLALPLNEYHDRLSGAADAASSLEIVAEGPVEKAGRPGTILTYAFTLKNTGASDDVFIVTLAGTDAVLGHLVPEGEVEIAAGESVRVTLGVRLPPGAAEGEQYEVLVFAHARDDPSKMAVSRTKTTATRGEDAAPDESAILLQAQRDAADTPAPGAALVVVGVAVAAVALGRRR